MKIKHEFPPNYAAILAVFPMAKATTVIFTYGDTLYVPYKLGIPQPLLAHETIHSLQQGDAPEAWWDLYLRDRDFRLQQELEAHRAEYLAYQNYGRNIRRAQLNIIAEKLASPLYKNMVKKDLAKKLIADKVQFLYTSKPATFANAVVAG